MTARDDRFGVMRRELRGLVIAVALLTVSTAHAAPWSFELPEGYTELPGAADAQLRTMRAMPRTLSVDGQIYVSPDQTVQLTRLTWDSDLTGGGGKLGIENLDEGMVQGAARHATKHISDSRHWVGDQLVAESIDDKGGIRIVQRKLYSADTNGVLHVLLLFCAGPADNLGTCERAQQTMQLTLPNQAALPDKSPREERDVAYRIGQITGVVLIVALLVWLVRKYG
jgi:hypothetical protein